MTPVTRLRLIVGCTMCAVLAGCGQEAKLDASAAQAEAARVVAETPRSLGEEWNGRAGDWELNLTLEGTELKGTVFHQGKVKTSKSECMATGTVSGNISPAGGVNWIAVGQDMEFIVSGTRNENSIQGTFESAGGAQGCSARLPVTLTRKPAA